MPWPQGWPYTDDQVNYLFVYFQSPNSVFAALATTILQVYEDQLREADAVFIAGHRSQLDRNLNPPRFPPNRWVHYLAICVADDIPLPPLRPDSESVARFRRLSVEDKHAINDGAVRLWGLLRRLRRPANGFAPMMVGMDVYRPLTRDPRSYTERFRQMQEIGERYVSGREDRVIALAFGMTGAVIGVAGASNRGSQYIRETRAARAARLARAAAANPDPEHPGANAGPGPYPEGDQSAGGRSPRSAGTDPGSPEMPRGTRARTASGELEEMVNRSGPQPIQFPINVYAGETAGEIRAVLQQTWEEFHPLQSLNHIARSPSAEGVLNVLREFSDVTGIRIVRRGAFAIHRETRPDRPLPADLSTINVGDPRNLPRINYMAIRGNSLWYDEQLLAHPEVFFNEANHSLCTEYIFGVRVERTFPVIQGLPPTGPSGQLHSPPSLLEWMVRDGPRVLDLIVDTALSLRGGNVPGGGS